MPRLRRLVLFDRFLFITRRLLPHRRMVEESEFGCLAGVMRERREKDHLLLRAWVFMPDLAAAGFPAQKHGGLRMTCIWLFSQNRGIQPANGIGVR